MLRPPTPLIAWQRKDLPAADTLDTDPVSTLLGRVERYWAALVPAYAPTPHADDTAIADALLQRLPHAVLARLPVNVMHQGRNVRLIYFVAIDPETFQEVGYAFGSHDLGTFVLRLVDRENGAYFDHDPDHASTRLWHALEEILDHVPHHWFVAALDPEPVLAPADTAFPLGNPSVGP